MKFGIKLWSINKTLIKTARDHFLKEDFNYIELSAIKNTFNKDILSHIEGIPSIIHCDNNDVNFAKEDHHERNMSAVQEAKKFADYLDSKYIIVHPGYGGNVLQVNSLLDEINDDRICIENMPGKTVDLKSGCLGKTYDELKKMNCSNFCLDFSHAIKAAVTLKIDIVDHINELLKLDPVIYHICDGKLDHEADEHLPLGEGDFDISFIKECISKHKSDMVTLETPRTLESFDEDIKNVKYFQSI